MRIGVVTGRLSKQAMATIERRIADHEAAHPERCWYWTFEPPFRAQCGRCRACKRERRKGAK